VTRALRVAVARLSHETNARSPIPTSVDELRRGAWDAGPALAARIARDGHEAPPPLHRAELWGAARAAEADGGVEIVPLLSVWAVPGGPLTADAWAAARDALLTELDAAGPLDGLLLALHGALTATGSAAPEVELLRAIRARRPGLKVLVVFDLHAHLTPDKLAALDLLVAYRTNPHRDLADAGARGLRLLVSTLRGQVRPTSTWRSLPMVLGGGTTVDFAPASRPAFQALRAAARRPGVLDASPFFCHPWVGDPSPCWAVHVTTDADEALAEQVADALADAVWSIRHAPPPQPTPATEALALVSRSWRRRLGPAALVDTSDIVGAGAPGDHTGLLRALRDHAPTLRAWVPLRDPAAVAHLHGAAIGAAHTLDVGGAWSPGHRLTVTGRLTHAGAGPGLGRTATLDLGGAALLLTEGPPLVLHPRQFAAAGLPIRRADVLVLKSLLLWLPNFYLLSRRMLVRTSGPTDFDRILEGPFAHPVHPLDPIDDWRPHDAWRRSPPPGADP
jgi:microcystin degradation protein MlrC